MNIENMRPILFSTDMVQAILRGEKTSTRRLPRKQPEFKNGETGIPELMDDGNFAFKVDGYETIYDYDVKAPYHAGDVLYVRETCSQAYIRSERGLGYDKRWFYRADGDLRPDAWKGNWTPSILMPREAARLFLKVTNVRFERLREIENSAPGPDNEVLREGFHYGCDFIAYWENMAKKSTKPGIGYFDDPWVWVIEFEVIKAKQEETK